MTTIVKTVLTASSVAALVVWLKHAYTGVRTAKPSQEYDDFSQPMHAAHDILTIDDDSAAEIIRRARPALERAREVG
jgi:hypothetical protein